MALILKSLPWRMCLSHPHEVHVAGQQREVGHLLGLVNIAEVTVGQQNIDDQLQVGLPSNWLPQQNHSCVSVKLKKIYYLYKKSDASQQP